MKPIDIKAYPGEEETVEILNSRLRMIPKLKAPVVIGKQKVVSLERALERLPDGSYSWTAEED